MVRKTRWGRNFVDRRDWCSYNEHLVMRGEYLLDLDWVEGWGKELAGMNRGKVGAPYRFPKSLIELQALWSAKGVPCRMIEGMTRRLCEIGRLPDFDDYTTVSRRINQLDYRLEPPTGDRLVVFSDGTSMQAVSGGEYLREKYGKKNRRWVQVIILGDAKTHEPVSFEVNIIPASEAESTKRQAEELLARGANIAGLGGDGAMDNKALWNFCDKQKLKPIIKPDKNALSNTDCALRNHTVKERDKLGYEKWSKKRGYGFRWPATEGIHSAIKRMFGEQLRATSETGMLQEAARKTWAYKKIKKS